MTKFKIGDEVVISMKGSKINGKPGMVAAIWLGDPNIYQVEFEDSHSVMVFEQCLKHRGQ